ncbi:MAG: amidohydrolase [Desulfobacterales bacterium]|nr:MAG: amidohydrolase [Desulfobacterales bacterium]
MAAEFQIALAQTTISPLPEDNVRAAEKWIQRASHQGADLLVLPEMFMALPTGEKPLAVLAEPLDGPFISAMSSLAVRYRIFVSCGFWEKVDGDEKRAANVAVVLDPTGNILTKYNKIHLFDALNVCESDLMKGGDLLPPLVTIRSFNIGFAICYDLRFPELFRNLAVRGADAVVVPAAWYSGPLKEEHWLTLLRARAIENTIYVGGANLCGKRFAGRSAFFDPFGIPLGDGGEGETLIFTRFLRDRIDAVREKLPVLNHIRKDLFHD